MNQEAFADKIAVRCINDAQLIPAKFPQSREPEQLNLSVCFRPEADIRGAVATYFANPSLLLKERPRHEGVRSLSDGRTNPLFQRI